MTRSALRCGVAALLIACAGAGCEESGGGRSAATPTAIAASTATPVPAATATPVPSFTPPQTATATATAAASPTVPRDSAEIAAELLNEIADGVCATDSTPGGAVRVLPILDGAVIECTSFTGHRGTVELRAFASADAAASAFAGAPGSVPDVAIGGGSLRRSCAPSDCSSAGSLSQDWAWLNGCWLVRGESFDDTPFLLSPQPRATVEAIVASSLAAALLTCPLAQCGDAAVTERFDDCQGSATEAECLAAGGRWGPYPFSGRPGCFCPTGQGGCPCARSGDCVGKCYAPLGAGPDLCGGVEHGVCSSEEPEGGCWCVFEATGVPTGLCIDP